MKSADTAGHCDDETCDRSRASHWPWHERSQAGRPGYLSVDGVATAGEYCRRGAKLVGDAIAGFA
jgi:hypothetical protein